MYIESIIDGPSRSSIFIGKFSSDKFGSDLINKLVLDESKMESFLWVMLNEFIVNFFKAFKIEFWQF
jgi:hypothetical protein